MQDTARPMHTIIVPSAVHATTYQNSGSNLSAITDARSAMPGSELFTLSLRFGANRVRKGAGGLECTPSLTVGALKYVLPPFAPHEIRHRRRKQEHRQHAADPDRHQ